MSKIVTLIGTVNLHSRKLFDLVNTLETRKGNLVFSISGKLPNDDNIDFDKIKNILFEVHKEKIKLSSEVIIVGKLGQTSRKELDFALSLKPSPLITWLSEKDINRLVEEV